MGVAPLIWIQVIEPSVTTALVVFNDMIMRMRM
jgi:hypothetical protein